MEKVNNTNIIYDGDKKKFNLQIVEKGQIVYARMFDHFPTPAEVVNAHEEVKRSKTSIVKNEITYKVEETKNVGYNVEFFVNGEFYDNSRYFFEPSQRQIEWAIEQIKKKIEAKNLPHNVIKRNISAEMKKDDYKARMREEYQQLRERTNKLEALITRYYKNDLDFILTCPIELLERQFNAMSDYLSVLRIRAQIENVEIE